MELKLVGSSFTMQDIFENDFKMNSRYPQMIGPKILSLGAMFLGQYLKENITFDTFQSFVPEEEMMQKYAEKVLKLHGAYGRLSKDDDIDVYKLKGMYLETAHRFQKLISPLTGKNSGIYHFFNDPENICKIEQIYNLFNTAEVVLNSNKWAARSKDFRGSLKPVLEKGLRDLDVSEMKPAQKVWVEFSTELRDDILVEIRKFYEENNDCRLQIPTKDFELFMINMANIFEVEVYERSKEWQYKD